MSDAIHTETYTHKCGKTYIVDVEADYDFGAPQDNSDYHGVVVELDFDPEDEDAVDAYIEANTYEDSPEEVEERVRLGMMRLLGRYGNYRRNHTNLYYDVWETLKKAKKDWGCTTDEEAAAAVDKDFAYLDGWYSDDWHWCTVIVSPTDENGERDEEHYHCIGGYESTIINPENREYFVEAIEDCIYQVEYDIRKAQHKDQLELPLFA